jgi:hypothetical protein
MLDADRRKWETVLEQWKQINGLRVWGHGRWRAHVLCDVCGTPMEGQSHGACRLSSYEDTWQPEEE